MAVRSFAAQDDKWRLAEVLQTKDDQVFVHYTGWSAKWREWIARDSERLQPPRTYSSGDTGPPKPGAAVAQPIAHPVYPSASSYPPVSSAPPAYTPSLRPSSRYDCRGECKWKRVLSMGLGHREMQSLDALFSRCCQLQDEYQERLLTEEDNQNAATFAAFRSALTALSAEIGRVEKALPPFAAFYTRKCADIVSTIQSGISETEEAVRRQLLALQEEAYMHQLRSQFQLVEVPADGSCLFAAVGKGMSVRAERMHQQEHEDRRSLANAQQQPQPFHPLLPSPSPAVVGASDAVVDHPASDGAALEEALHMHPAAAAAVVGMEDSNPVPSAAPMSPRHLPYLYRKQSVHHLLSTPSFHQLIRHEVREALVQEREGHGDPTSAAIVRELRSRFPTSEQLEAALDGEDALQVYASVMEKEGIYGTHLEVEALSSALHVPVHIYYRAGSEHDGVAEHGGQLRPTQVIGEHEPGPPISLAYYMGNRHYNLLVPRPPPPPPQPTPPPSLPSSAPPALLKAPQELSVSSRSQMAGSDDELMVALLENGTPSPLPPVAESVAAGAAAPETLTLKRSRSSGHPVTDKSPASDAGSAGGSGVGRLRQRGASKDELHLLNASPTRQSHVRSVVSSWDAGAPQGLLKAAVVEHAEVAHLHPPHEQLHPPDADARPRSPSTPSTPASGPRSRSPSASRSRSSSSSSASQMQLLVLYPPVSATPVPLTIHRFRPLRHLLYELPVSSSAALSRQSDHSLLDVERTPADYALLEGEVLLLEAAPHHASFSASHTSAHSSSHHDAAPAAHHTDPHAAVPHTASRASASVPPSAARAAADTAAVKAVVQGMVEYVAVEQSE